jgi:hypothetical protein
VPPVLHVPGLHGEGVKDRVLETLDLDRERGNIKEGE